MRKKVLILLMAVAFAAASLLVPATASAGFKICVLHKGGPTILISTAAAETHLAEPPLGHGDTLLNTNCTPIE